MFNYSTIFHNTRKQRIGVLGYKREKRFFRIFGAFKHLGRFLILQILFQLTKYSRVCVKKTANLQRM